MEGFGVDKLLLILVIVLVLFGARRVPEIGASIGKGIREFKRGMKDLGSDDEEKNAVENRVDRNASLNAAAPQTNETGVPPKRLLTPRE